MDVIRSFLAFTRSQKLPRSSPVNPLEHFLSEHNLNLAWQQKIMPAFACPVTVQAECVSAERVL